MKIGFSLPNIGPIGTAEAITKVVAAHRGPGIQQLVDDRTLTVSTQAAKTLPRHAGRIAAGNLQAGADPLDALTYVAAHTKKIKLGTSVLDMPYYNPVMLARRLTTIDVLSNGRLCVGLGLGWSKDEMDATGADMKKRGALADEFLPLLKAIWTTNPVEFHGKFFNVPKSYIDLKPVQKPHPPIYLGAFVRAALQRLANLADGWNPVFIPVPCMAEMFSSIKQMAKEAGRDPSALVMVVHAVLEITEKPLGKDRAIFSGSLEQISDDVRDCAKIGVDEVFFDPAFAHGGQSLDRWLSLLEQLQGMMTVG
jgi:probable F420-dependent oxidoreductase